MNEHSASRDTDGSDEPIAIAEPAGLEPLVPPLPKDEEFARISLNADLQTRSSHVVWSPEADDPPDIWIVLDEGVRYAVEVTTIPFTTSTGRQVLEELGRQRGAIDQVLEALNASGIVRGRWTLSSHTSRSVKVARERLESALRSFFASSELERQDELSIDVGGSEARLRRSRGEGNHIDHVWIDIDEYEPGAEIEDLRRFLPRAVSEKAEKMATVPCPWILAIIDLNGWGRERWGDLLPDVAERFEAIYRIERERAVLVHAGKSFPTRCTKERVPSLATAPDRLDRARR